MRTRHHAMVWTLVERVVSTPVHRRLAGSLGDGSWMEHGLCRQVDPDMFFPAERTGMQDNGRVNSFNARRVCSMCPVKTLCLEYAVRHPSDMDGVWGGMTRYERRPLRQAVHGQPAYEPDPEVAA